MSTADAVDREVAWLVAVDALPSLLATAGGPWSIVQAYWPRTPQTRLSGIYLQRGTTTEVRFSNQRKINTYDFHAKLWWPIGSTTTSSGIWETEQRNFDTAIDLLIARIRGTRLDHTHGGRFLSVAEAPEPGRITVSYSDPEQTGNGNPACLRAAVRYEADDRDFTA